MYLESPCYLDGVKLHNKQVIRLLEFVQLSGCFGTLIRSITTSRNSMTKLFVAFLSILLAGCASTFTTYSNTFIKPLQPINEMKVLYLENVLIDSATKNPIDFSDIGYTDLPELFRDRVQIIFDLNNIHSDYTTFKKPNFGQKEAIQAVKWSNTGGAYPTMLIIEVVSGSIVSGQRTPRTTTINMHANLIDTKTNLRIWTGQFMNRFMQPPVGRMGFDNESTDRLLKTILEQMGKDKIINLVEGKVSMPKKENGKI